MPNADQFSNTINMVREGYNEIAEIYEGFSDSNISELDIFKQFVSSVNPKKRILELGCGTGIKTCKYFLDNDFQYTGVDLSEKQIELAKKHFPGLEKHFELGEMLSYCKKMEDKSFDGMIALFSIFHLPGNQHIELFKNIKRIVIKGSPILFTSSHFEDEGTEDNWLGGSKPMFWSNHPYTWYQEKLPEIGFKYINTFKREAVFANEIETHYFLLFQA